ncbi:MAG: hypothetical protein ACOX5R_11455 [bacterium]
MTCRRFPWRLQGQIAGNPATLIPSPAPPRNITVTILPQPVSAPLPVRERGVGRSHGFPGQRPVPTTKKPPVAGAFGAVRYFVEPRRLFAVWRAWARPAALPLCQDCKVAARSACLRSLPW